MSIFTKRPRTEAEAAAAFMKDLKVTPPKEEGADPVKARFDRHHQRIKDIEQGMLQSAKLMNLLAHSIRALEDRLKKIEEIIQPGKWAN